MRRRRGHHPEARLGGSSGEGGSAGGVGAGGPRGSAVGSLMTRWGRWGRRRPDLQANERAAQGVMVTPHMHATRRNERNRMNGHTRSHPVQGVGVAAIFGKNRRVARVPCLLPLD